MKKGRGLSVGVLLLLCLLALQASAQAPGDAQPIPCNSSGALNLAHTYPNDWNLLMDSFNYRTLVSVDPVTASTPQAQRPVWQVRNFDGNGVGFRPGFGGTCRTGTCVCDSGQDNWVFTQHIAYLSAREIRIEVTYTLEVCQPGQQQPQCNINFLTFHRYDRDQPNSAAQVDTDNYNQLQQIDCPNAGSREVTTTFTFLRPGARQGFYLGIKDTGTCGSIRRLQVYYLVCPGAAEHLVTYPELALTPDGVTTGEASCVANAELDSGESADIRAFNDGRCDYEVSCRCLEGYEENPPRSQNGGTDPATCRACSPGFYRSFLNDTCVACPSLNTVQTGANSSICPCLDGYFRAAGESAGFSCTAPPNAVRNLRAESSSETEIVVRWDAPDRPGRTDYYYSVSRSIPGDLNNFQTLNDRLTNRASNVMFRVTNLVPFTAYKIRVSVHNGVSQNDSANYQLRVREVTASTEEGRPGPPTNLQPLCTVVVWQSPDMPNGIIIGYELDLGTFPYTRLPADTIFHVVPEDKLISGVCVRVRARTAIGDGAWSHTGDLGCGDGPMCSSVTQPNTTTDPTPSGGPLIEVNNILFNVIEVDVSEELQTSVEEVELRFTPIDSDESFVIQAKLEETKFVVIPDDSRLEKQENYLLEVRPLLGDGSTAEWSLPPLQFQFRGFELTSVATANEDNCLEIVKKTLAIAIVVTLVGTAVLTALLVSALAYLCVHCKREKKQTYNNGDGGGVNNNLYNLKDSFRK